MLRLLLRRPLADGSRAHSATWAIPRDLLMATLIWFGSSILLSVPWTLAWTSDRHSQYLWRVPLANLAGIVPPLGLIGFISPVIGAGYLFPGTGWFGLAATVLLPGIVLALCHSSASSARIGLRVALTAGVAMGIYAHAFIAGQPTLPARWEAVNTNFGDLSRPFQDFSAAQSIQEHVAASQARVVIFPEFVVPFWTDATRDFWQPDARSAAALAGRYLRLAQVFRASGLVRATDATMWIWSSRTTFSPPFRRFN